MSEVHVHPTDIGTGDNLHIVDIVERADNDAATANADVLVMINEHSFRDIGAANHFEEV